MRISDKNRLFFICPLCSNNDLNGDCARLGIVG